MQQLGALMNYWKKYVEATECLTRALDAARQCNDFRLELETLVELAEAKRHAAPGEAIDTLLQCAGLAKNVGDLATEQRSWQRLGLIHESMNSIPKARESYETSLLLAQQLSLDAAVATLQNTLEQIRQ